MREGRVDFAQTLGGAVEQDARVGLGCKEVQELDGGAEYELRPGDPLPDCQWMRQGQASGWCDGCDGRKTYQVRLASMNGPTSGPMTEP